MLKLGIYRPEQYHAGHPSGWLARFERALRRNRIALTLLRTDVPATPQQIELFENTIPQVRLASGVYRTTFRGRFRGFDEFVNSRLSDRFDANAPLRIEDWAASDCLTSSEWAASLFPLFPAATITASDLTLFLVEARLPDGSSYVMETGGELLQYVRPPFVIRLNPPEPAVLVVNSFLEKRARTRFGPLRESWRIPNDWLNSECPDTFEQAPFVFRKIPLIHPDARTLRQSSDRFAIRRHSVFEPSEGLCNVVRTMNIFNLAYFAKDRLLAGARAAALSLAEGGVWIVGRTYQENPPAHNASLFVREKKGFRLLERFGAGSEIEELVLTSLAV